MHYDIRLICKISGNPEATEDIGYPTRESAESSLADMTEGDDPTLTYVVVACDLPGSDEIHDVDLSYYHHQRECLGDHTAALARYVGVPTDDLIRRV
jgi:hypothetical protein